jgi:hypothetical protein
MAEGKVKAAAVAGAAVVAAAQIAGGTAQAKEPV